MSSLPKVAIVGRPNVGKSALFNRICRKRLSIVNEAEGVTRDRIYCDAELFGQPFEAIDTGGINPSSPALFNDEIRRQAEIAIEEADSIIMVVDAHVPITDLDKDVARILLSTNKPVCLAVNKVDDVCHEHLVHEFHSLGITDMIPTSAEHNKNITEILEAALKNIKVSDEDDERDNSLRIAIVGRTNVGKSTYLNTLLQEERCITSDIAGTTRDSIDIPFTWNETQYTLIDTAGIRRKNSEHEVVDKFAYMRTQRAIERCDICILFLDASQGFTTQDKKIANLIEKSGKGCILAFNKWDLVKGFRMEHCIKSVRDECPFMNYCPSFFLSAKTGRNFDKLFPIIEEVHANMSKRITTGQLNTFVEKAVQACHAPMITGKRLRIYYLTQVGTTPPRFIFFINNPALITEAYRKYLYNRFRAEFSFTGLPISFHFRGRSKASQKRSVAICGEK
jgi:GTPase